ncbi:hypothetical protein WKW80_02010 [Variovorax humicola]|uniref:Polysaccharide biosynthesis protein n=1 Tax=Variovorax humicola TaxID=1769758 RepID=A0ABU8VSN7_9BURK
MNFKARLRQALAVGSVESLGVVVGGLAGLLIVNLLPKDQYAQYTFLITCMTWMLGITDVGLAHCCLPLVGQRASETPWVVGVCYQVFRKRGWLLCLGTLIVVPYWWVTTHQHGWSDWPYWIASACMLVLVFFSLSAFYSNTVLLILGHIATLNRVNFYGLATRALLIAAVLLLLPVASYSIAAVVAATLAASMLSVVLYRRGLAAHEVRPHVLAKAEAAAVDAAMYRMAKPLVLPALFFQFQGVITVFIVSLFGTASMLAEVGALGRIAMLLIVFDRVAATVLFPAIARAADGPRLVLMVLRAHAAYVGIMLMVFLSALLWPQYWMLLIGPHYKGQQSLLWMVFLSTLLLNCAQFAFMTLTSRGHTRHQTFVVFFVLALQVLCLSVFGVRSLQAVLALGVATSLGHFLYQYAMLGIWFSEREKRNLAT